MAGNIEYSTTGKPHPYHLVRPNIWPLISAFAGGFFAMMMLMYFPGYREALQAGGTNLPFPWGPLLGVVSIMICMFFWWKDVIYESVVEKAHTKIAEIGLRFGMALFIASEVMFFVAFFWAFFSSSLFPSQAIGFVWPPKNIHTIAAFDLPFLMTMILLLSGCTVTWAHHAILEGDNKNAVKALGVTVFLGLAFLCFQIYEYAHAHFGFTEGIPFNILHGHWFSRLPRLCRHRVPRRVLGQSPKGPLHPRSPFRLRSRCLVLALRRCCLAIPVRRHLLVGQ